MDFSLTDEQWALRDVIRSFARAELAPTYLERARVDAWPWEQYRQVADLGVLGMLAGEEWGGEPVQDFVSAGIAMEELAYADFNVSNCVLPALITTSILREHGSRRVQEAWLPRIVGGEAIVALGLTEPGSGSDAAGMRMRAERIDGGWRLNGEKTSITAIPPAEAAIMFAITDPAAGARGISAFLVPLHVAGVATAPIPDAGWLPVGRGSIALQDVEVPDDAMIGAPGEAFRVVMRNFDFTRPLLALTGIGCAQAALDETVEHVRERKAFGTTLSRFEGISFPLAEHTTYLEAARLICYRALWKRNVGEPHSVDAAMAKWLGPLSASKAVHDCLLMFGHYGYSTEYPLEQRLRDVVAVEIADGTAQIQKLIIARDLFGRDFLPYGPPVNGDRTMAPARS